MKKFLATTVCCLALVPTGTFAFHTVFPDGNVMAHAITAMPAPGPFTSCHPSLAWARLFVLDVNNLSTLSPLHLRALGNCINTTGDSVVGYLFDRYGPAAPTIVDTGAAYSVEWATQQNVGGTWSPAGPFTLTVSKSLLH